MTRHVRECDNLSIFAAFSMVSTHMLGLVRRAVGVTSRDDVRPWHTRGSTACRRGVGRRPRLRCTAASIKVINTPPQAPRANVRSHRRPPAFGQRRARPDLVRGSHSSARYAKHPPGSRRTRTDSPRRRRCSSKTPARRVPSARARTHPGSGGRPARAGWGRRGRPPRLRNNPEVPDPFSETSRTLSDL
jgi:hypothetical protein